MTDLKEIYRQFEKESLARLSSGKSGKSAKIRELVVKLFEDLKKDKILMAAAYKAVSGYFEEKGDKVDRTMFSGVIRRSFQVEKDEETGRLWILRPGA